MRGEPEQGRQCNLRGFVSDINKVINTMRLYVTQFKTTVAIIVSDVVHNCS